MKQTLEGWKDGVTIGENKIFNLRNDTTPIAVDKNVVAALTQDHK